MVGVHRRAGGSRGISRGLLVIVALIVILIILGFLWSLLGDRISKQGQDAAGRCVEGDLAVSIISDPALAAPLTTVADEYNATDPVARDRCITIDVRPADAKVTLDGLTGTWDAASRGQYPAAWIPQSSVWSSQLTAANPSIVDGDSASLVSSPVVLAISTEAEDAMDGNVGWIDLPTLQRSDAAMDRLGLQGWGPLQMAMPIGPQTDATLLAAQAIAAQISRTTSGALSPEDAASPLVSSTLTRMKSEAPPTDLGTAESGVQMLMKQTDPAAGTLHAVPITEQQLYLQTKDDADPGVVAFLPTGPTPMADFPVVTLRGDQVDVAARDAVNDFINYVHAPEQMSTITELGFRGGGRLPPATAAVTFPVTPSPMPAPSAPAQNSITEVLTRR
ncbi:extracellular solute-binding protein [Williamsia limnetica]|uniref:Extracellular solute-binding protein n=1 Tax=Williamsia limnetica TaxID=882452 RepID=A0A318RSZ1_WILLI|nr:substrate-binding domain-containing protein [Williamsia limnetica]PYE20709.1 extracellular solute-binding protein [Williamsia limnetica]